MREYVLVMYDIADSRRLQQVHKIMRGFGDGFQKSVFLCQMSRKEEMILKVKLDDVIKPSEDQVVFIRLGQIDKSNISDPKKWVILGRKIDISDNSILIF